MPNFWFANQKSQKVLFGLSVYILMDNLYHRCYQGSVKYRSIQLHILYLQYFVLEQYYTRIFCGGNR